MLSNPMTLGADIAHNVASSGRDPGQAHQKYFLSLDLSSDHMGLIVVDEFLDVIFGECVKFDTDLPEYGTQNGCHTDGEASTSPTHLHVKALDILLQRVSSQVELKRVKCIGGSAQQHNSVWWSKAASALLSRLAPNKPLHEQLPPEQTWTLPNPPNFYDMSTDAQAQSLEWLIGGSEETARRSGVRAFCRFTGVQIMKVQQTRPNILEATDRISSASSFLSSLLLGSSLEQAFPLFLLEASIAPLSESDAASMSLWNMNEKRWDHVVLDFIVGKDSAQPGSSSEAAKLIQKLGEPYHDNSVPLGPIASYFVRRYGFSADCQIAGFVGHHQATFLSQQLRPRDVMICLGDCDSDSVLLSLPRYLPDSTRQILPSPARSSSNFASEMPFMALLEYKDGDLARRFLRDTYCNGSWHTFDTLVTLISEGGAIGLDDKLYTFFWPHGELGSWQGISRFEAGQRVKEFKDQRVNPRSLLESQFLTMRLQLSRINQGLRPPESSIVTLAPTYSLLGFNPYDHSVLPKRIIVIGKASRSPVTIELLSSILGVPVYQSVALCPSTYSTVFFGNQLAITPAALGSCYKAAWTYVRRFNLNQSYNDFLGERNIQRSKRLKSSLGRLDTSVSSIQSSQPEQRGTANFSNTNSASALWNQDVSSLELSKDATIPVVPIQTDFEDLEDGLLKVAEPDEDLFQRYGGQIEEFARLDKSIRRGVL